MGRLLPFIALVCFLSYSNSQKQDALNFLKSYNAEAPQYSWSINEASWKAATNITQHNSDKEGEEWLRYSKYMREQRTKARSINIKDVGLDESSLRQFKLLLQTMTSSNDSVTRAALKVGSSMSSIYSTGAVPMDPVIKTVKATKGILNLDPHLTEIMRSSQDADELLYAWKGWRDAVGPKLGPKYAEYVRLHNIGARENGWEDAGDYKRRASYERPDLPELADEFWTELKPVYDELHAYVRYRLSLVYPELVKDGEPIPAHLLGNMWAQAWDSVYERIKPFDTKPLDITPTLIKKGYNTERMFKESEAFFTSIGWQKLPPSFWQKSMLEKPADRDVVCHASAWDFSIVKDGSKDVRVKMCTTINQDDYITIHHELGHIYYDLLYWNQPYTFRDGANPGFHEAVGDVLALSVQTPDHLKAVGLLDKISSTANADINFLLKTAMGKIAFLPFGFLMDKWMWNVYNGKIEQKDYNRAWWQLREKYQGVKAPVDRSENDFDPGAKYHIPADTPYIRYFFAHILQYSFHKHACVAAGNKGPLHRCSIYKSKEAGKALGNMLSLGKSKRWDEALEIMTGSKKMSAQPIKEYFEPLLKWLAKERKLKGYKKGWSLSPDALKPSSTRPRPALIPFF